MPMRGMTGIYDGITDVICDYGRDLVDCPRALTDLLIDEHDARLTGMDRVEACQALVGASFQMQEL